MSDASPQPPSKKKPIIWIIIGVALAGIAVVALVTKPWLLFIDQRVNDDVSALVPTAQSTQPASANESESPEQTKAPAPATTVLATGSFISHEHDTTGTASIVQQADGKRVLVIENLDTTNGPDVRIWFTDAPVIEGSEGWRTPDGKPYVDLGLIKGNKGNQIYELPADFDLAKYPNLFLWCKQFGVSFGAAELTPGN